MRLLERFRAASARRHFSPRTIDCYENWIRRFLTFCRASDGTWRHPRELRGPEVEAFLNHLVLDRRLSASSQHQAINALVFLYKHVLGEELGEDHLGRIAAERARRPQRVPTVLSVGEVERVLAAIPAGSVRRLMAEVLYGCGLRVMECCTLRLRDVDFARSQIIIRAAKGDKDRVVMLPQRLREPLVRQVARVTEQWRGDCLRGAGYAPVLPAIAHKCPSADRQVAWQFLFPSSLLRRDAHTPTDRGWTRPSPWRPGGAGCTSASPATPSATASRRIRWRRVTTSDRFRRCSATRRSKPP